MAEVTLETFRAAALRAGERLRGEEGASEEVEASQTPREVIRERIKALIEEGHEEDFVRSVSSRTADRIAEMLWPEKNLEVKKKRAEMEVERGALMGYIKEILQEEA